MAKASGLAWTTYSVDDASNAQQAIINDLTDLKITTPRAVQDITGIDKTAIERLLLLADCVLTANGVFNGAANKSHAVFSTIPLASSPPRLVTIVVNAKTLPVTCVLTDYPLTRATSGALTWSVPGSLSSGTPPTWA